MTLEKIIRIAQLTRLNNIAPNANYKSLKTDWNKCFRILTYLYSIVQYKLTIKSENDINVNNNYFQAGHFVNWSTTNLENHFTDKTIKEIDVNSLIESYFEDKLITITKEDLEKQMSLTSEDAQNLLTSKPFDVDSKTIKNDLRTLSKVQIERKFIIEVVTKIYTNNTKIYAINNNLTLERIFANNESGNSLNLYETLYDIYFDDLLSTTSESLRDKQRFFIKFQHIISENEQDNLGDIIEELKEIWETNNQLISIKYASSSQKTKKEYTIYPVSLFYNQRAIYLTGYGQSPAAENRYNLDYYNYRLDRLCKQENGKYIIPIEWNKDNEDIHYKFTDDKKDIQQKNSQSIYEELSKALGVDIHRKPKTMLLRFPREFHEGYIRGSKRHETFKQLKFENTNQFLQALKKVSVTEITATDQELIKKIVTTYPNDAYYTMNYRHGKEGGHDVESDVIMRLRAWGHNVEVLFPPDLRKRIKEDYQKAWELY